MLARLFCFYFVTTCKGKILTGAGFSADLTSVKCHLYQIDCDTAPVVTAKVTPARA
jgi:hypothetical protein